MPAPAVPPRFWTHSPDGAGRVQLAYAVRGGAVHAVLVAVGALLVAGGCAAAFWLVRGWGLTAAGWVFLVLAPGGAVLAGVYVLDRMLWMRIEYALGDGVLGAHRVSFFGNARTDIPRSAILGIAQRYSPPHKDAPSGDPGTWTTFVEWRTPEGERRDLAIDGLHSAEERRWLGPLLADWAQVPLTRGHAAGFEEAPASELPDD